MTVMCKIRRMITQTHICPRCASSKLTRNGKTKAGKQKFRCHSCGCYGTLNPDYGYSENRKNEILRAYHERSSLRGLERTFGVARQTVSAWLKKSLWFATPRHYIGASPTRRCAWARRTVVVCSIQNQRLLGLGRTLPQNSASGVMVCWWP